MLRPPTSSDFTRKLSFGLFKSLGSNCEVDAIKPAEQETSKYVVAKSCAPSIFESWKPKVPDLRKSCPPIKAHMSSQFKVKLCTAGMKVPEKTRCELEAKARDCQKICHPKWMMHCPPRAKNQGDDLWRRLYIVSWSNEETSAKKLKDAIHLHLPNRKINKNSQICKVDGPQPILRACLTKCKNSKGKVEQKPKKKRIRKKCAPKIPEPDWNHDGYIG